MAQRQVVMSMQDMARAQRAQQQPGGVVYSQVPQAYQMQEEPIGDRFTLFGDKHYAVDWGTVAIILLLLLTLAVSIVAMVFAILAWKKDPCDTCDDDLILSESTSGSTTADSGNSTSTTDVSTDSTTSAGTSTSDTSTTTTDTTGQTSFDISQTTTGVGARRRSMKMKQQQQQEAAAAA